MSEISLQDTRIDPELNRSGQGRGEGASNLQGCQDHRPPGMHVYTLSTQIHFLRQRR